MTKIEFLDLQFDALSPSEALQNIVCLSQQVRFSFVVTPNVDHLVRLQREGGALRAAYRDASLCLCDSRILSRLSALSGRRLPVVTGSDLTASLIANALTPGTRVVLIGGSPAQLRWLRQKRPLVEWQQHIPPMGLRSDREAQAAVISFVEEAKAAYILLAIGAPQSELLAASIYHRGIARGVALCVGASVEFVTGEKRRAPLALSKLGLEWAFRLAIEPRRLWRRYLLEGPAIFRIWLNWRRSVRD